MQIGNGSGLIGALVNNTMTTVGVKYACPNGGGSVLFMNPNFPPSGMASIAHDWTPGIPTSPTNLGAAYTKAKSLLGGAPDEFLNWENTEALP